MDRTASLLLAIVVAAGCSSEPRVVVSSKNFTEQVLLGEIIAQQIERKAGLPVDRKLNLGGTLLAHEALKKGSIDLYPEYTGTALTAVLKQPVSRDPAAVLERVREGYRPLGLEWLQPLGFDNTFAMVVRADTARRDGLRTISDAARRAQPWRLGVGYEFVQRPDGLDGLVHAYSLRLDGGPVTMDLGLLYPALQSGRIGMAAASATDGRLADADFTVLADDRRYFPPYECAIVVRQAALTRFPGLRAALEELSGRISDADMRRMNEAVDRDHRSVAEVAREFLQLPPRTAVSVRTE
jgi:glycine betaine/choline ABC-type transport system substrate-binding protein